ncbi:MAG: hypothetical protein M1821_000108 [Bathelium mastoideum]|nr:MAG: hypothetical protein M1821_000108 [Bathelium mastoideum]KAI9687860.1 MAG: hypothetical protein M1822_001941 [Bathelium mastoideum]
MAKRIPRWLGNGRAEGDPTGNEVRDVMRSRDKQDDQSYWHQSGAGAGEANQAKASGASEIDRSGGACVIRDNHRDSKPIEGAGRMLCAAVLLLAECPWRSTGNKLDGGMTFAAARTGKGNCRGSVAPAARQVSDTRGHDAPAL